MSLSGVLPFDRTSRLVARTLGLAVRELQDALRPATEADMPQVTQFRRPLTEGHAAWNDDAHLLWRYRLGRRTMALGDLWVLAPAGRVVAILGTEDVCLVVRGVRIAAERPMDLQVDPAAVSSGLGVWMNQAVAERSAAVLAIGGNRNSKGIVERLFKPLPAMHTCTAVLDSRPFLRKLSAPAMVLPMLVAAGNLYLHLRHRQRLEPGDGALETRPIERFARDDGLDDAAPDPDVLAFERNASALNHRLLDNPQQQYRIEGCFLHNRRVGAVAWRIQPGLEGLPQATIIDLWARADRRCAIERLLLSRVLAEAGGRGCHAVRMSTPDERLKSTLRSMGFANPAGGAGVPMGLLTRHASIAGHIDTAGVCAITPLLDDDDGLWVRPRVKG